jgi:CRISPR-associated endonuclease Csn1
MTEPFASILGRYDDVARRAAIDEAIGRRRRSTRSANLGVFTGYRIGFDIGNGNIGWCILFERGAVPHFLTAEAIAAHNAQLAAGEPKTQLPNLDLFVPLGTHKFTARDSDGKSLSKVRAEARARRHTLDARQSRRWHLRELLVKEGLLPAKEEDTQGLKEVKADVLRVQLLEPGAATHRHDLGRALYSALKRRGWMKPVGRAGVMEDSSFGSGATAKYRQALAAFSSRTVGEFLDRCQRDAKADGRLIRKRHKPLTWQKKHDKERPKEGSEPKSYEVFPFLSPTFELMWDEARALREAQKGKFQIADDLWEKIKGKAEFRRLLKPTKPGRCEFIPGEWRCIRALPTFQEFRILQQADNLRTSGKSLSDDQFRRAVAILHGVEKISVRDLGKQIGDPRLGFAEKDSSRTLIGAKTDTGLAVILGDTWRAIEDIDKRDEWIMRFLSRHPMSAVDAEPKEWTKSDDAKLERDCAMSFGAGALERVRAGIGKMLEDKFASLSARAARILAKGYRARLDHEARLDLLASEGGASVAAVRLFERLPYYGEVMPDLAVEAARFAPAARTAKEELEHGRAPNPDVHIVLNRLRRVTNAIIDMMGGILPTVCTVEVAREALSEEAADKRGKQMRARQQLRESIEQDIERALGGNAMPTSTTIQYWRRHARQSHSRAGMHQDRAS